MLRVPVRIPMNLFIEGWSLDDGACSWLIENIGNPGFDWGASIDHFDCDMAVFRFKNEYDAILFKLRWS